MTASYLPGTTTNPPLASTFRDADNVLNDAAPVTFDLVAPNGTFLTGGVPVRDSLGTYHYAWAIPVDAATGVWSIAWHGTINGEAVDATESFLIGAVAVPPSPGAVVCQLWAQPAEVAGTATVAEKTTALTIASDTLYAFSGRQFPGLCTDVVRPCPRRHYDAPPVVIAGFYVGNGIPTLSPAGWGTQVGGDCSCGQMTGYNGGYSRVELGAVPVVSIEQVKIDGAVVDPALYQIDEHRYLVAVPDLVTGVVRPWPHRQDIDLPATEVGTFEVTYVFGRPAPAGGKAAAILLATQILKASSGDDCQLPANVQQLIRQGVTLSMGDPSVMFDKGATGIKAVDRWIASVNPHHLNEPGRVLSPDVPRPSVHVRT